MVSKPRTNIWLYLHFLISILSPLKQYGLSSFGVIKNNFQLCSFSRNEVHIVVLWDHCRSGFYFITEVKCKWNCSIYQAGYNCTTPLIFPCFSFLFSLIWFGRKSFPNPFSSPTLSLSGLRMWWERVNHLLCLFFLSLALLLTFSCIFITHITAICAISPVQSGKLSRIYVP